MPKLPIVGDDFNVWGNELNAFLSVVHDPNTGLLLPAAAIPGVITQQGGLVVGGAAGVPFQLAPGTPGYVLTMGGASNPVWAPAPTGFFNPMKHLGDLIYGGAAGVANALAIGTTNQVLTVGGGGVPVWATPVTGFADPTTTNGDMIARLAGVTTRLPIGSTGQILTVAGGVPAWSNAITLYPSGDNSGVTNTDGVAIAAALAANNRVILAPGNWYVGVTGSTANGITLTGAGPTTPGQVIEGAGPGLTKIFYMGNGAGISAHGTQTGGANYQGVGTTIANLEIDMSLCGATATITGVDFGDQYSIFLFRVTVSNAVSSGTTNNQGANPLGAVGFGWNNYTTLTEKLYMLFCTVNNCGTPNTGTGATPVTGGGAGLSLFSASGASTSHMYHRIMLHANQQPGQNIISIARQGHLMNGTIEVWGNMNCPTVNNGCAAISMGTGPSSDQAGHIQRESIDLHIELDGNTSLATTAPFTIYAGPNSDHTINRAFGRLQFLGTMNGNFQPSNLPVTTDGVFEFEGPIIGGETTLTTPPTETYPSGTTVTYNGITMMLYVQVVGGVISAVNYNGVNMPSNAFNGPFKMHAGMTIKFTYTGVLTPYSIPCGMAY